MSFVWEYSKNPDDMLPNMVSTFKKLGFEVTAEGVETEEMAKEMRDIGCDYIQGYYYGKPMPMNEFVKRYS